MYSPQQTVIMGKHKPVFNARVARAVSIPKFPTTRNKEQLRRTLTHRQRQNVDGTRYEMMLRATKLLQQRGNEGSNRTLFRENTHAISDITIILLQHYYFFYVTKSEDDSQKNQSLIVQIKKINECTFQNFIYN